MDINEVMDLSSRANYIQNLDETLLKVCALITNSEHLVHIIKKTNEMIKLSNCKMIITIMTDIYFVVPRGKLVLRLVNKAEYGMLIFYNTTSDAYFKGILFPSIKNCESVKLDKDILLSLYYVLHASLHVEKQTDRIIYNHIFSNHTSVTIEHIPFFGKFVNIQVLVSSKLQNVERDHSEAIVITKNLMQELLITRDDLIRHTF